jgi:EAL domain-containing protein (putative c-di-GMP-specific phosphodiesterase class I)
MEIGTSPGTRDRFRPFAFAWADLIIEVEGDVISFAAGAAEPLLGRSARALVGQPLGDIAAPADRRLIDTVVEMIRLHGRAGETTIRLRGPGDMRPPVVVTGYCLGAASEAPLYLALRARLRFPEVEDEAPRDDATGLYAGDSFHKLAAARLKALAQSGQLSDVALVMVDGITEAGGTLGSRERETLQATLGALMRSASIDGDAAALVTEGKFCLLADAGQDLGELRQRIGETMQEFAPQSEVQIVSASIPVGPADQISDEDLAKGLLYTLQKFEKVNDHVSLAALAGNIPQLVDQTLGQLKLFRRLVQNREWDVALQPIIGLKHGEVHHFEALCRFHGFGKDTSPYKVINFAEETGLIHEFDLSMAAKVIDWLSRQPRNNDSYRVAVNVSGFSIGQASYLEGLNALLARHPWTAGRLIFEITESSRMSDLDSANVFIQGLRSKGYEVCLDDFGAGAASFQYLSVLEVDVVKLDGSAVKNAQRAAKGRAFLSALTELCRRLSIETVAEMVDTPEALQFVRDCGCDFVQGWLFGKPSTDVSDFAPYPNRELLRRMGRR